jgi:hypothetical protein
LNGGALPLPISGGVGRGVYLDHDAVS